MPGSTAANVGGKILKGRPLRQDYLQFVIDWNLEGEINKFTAEHQFDSDAEEVRDYFNAVIELIELVISTYHNSILGLNWCKLYG